MARIVGIMNSGVASCAVCGHPYPPDMLIMRRDYKLVCRYHDYWPDREEMLANIAEQRTYFRRYVHIQGHTPIMADGTPLPPVIIPGGGGGGGGGTPGDPGPGGPGPGPQPEPDPTANYIDGSCEVIE